MRIVVPPSLLAELRQRCASRPAPWHPADRDLEAFCILDGPGPAVHVTADGRVLTDAVEWEGRHLRDASDHEALGGLVAGARCTGIAALLDLVPPRPADGRACARCGGSRWRTLRSPEVAPERGQPVTIVCPHCSGRGWTIDLDLTGAPPGPHDRRVGEVFARRYRLDAVFAVGAHATLYRARDALLGRDVAVKVIDPPEGDEPFVQRLLIESRGIRDLGHEGIVEVHDGGTERGAVFLVMDDPLDGETLARRVARGPVALPEAVEILRGLASAFARAEVFDLAHRDLTPARVLVGREGGPVRVRVLEFGIALLDEMRPPFLHWIGTPAYMPPEVGRGLENSARGVLYTLGAIAFEMLAGRPPFVGEPGDVMRQHVMDPPPELTALAPVVPPSLAALVMSLIEKDPGRRPADAAAVMTGLDRVAPALTPPKYPV